MSILIGADFVPTCSNIDLFARGDIDSLFGNALKEELFKADYRIFNLEIPLVDSENPIRKCGPNLIAPTDTINGYKAARIDLLTLANNHIMDQDVQGLESTLQVLDQSGIYHLGAGYSLADAKEPFFYNFSGKKIGIYACVEHEFSIADNDKPGANPFDPLWSLDHITELKKESDFVIVLYHGGKEHYRYPSPLLQKTCRRFADKGANLVLCQHSHCIGCEEKYHDATIVYGQGNFLFDHSNHEYWQTGLIVKVDNDFSITYIPLVKEGNVVRLASNKQKEEILKCFYSRSAEIQEAGFIDNKYSEFADSYMNFYLQAFSGKHSTCFRLINKLLRGKYMRYNLARSYDIVNKVNIANFIDCESHRELVSQALKNEYMINDYMG